MENVSTVRYGVQAALSVAAAWIAKQLGGWDDALRFLVICMVVDYVTGLVVAGVFKKSGKTETGALSSASGLKGICKKLGMLVLVALAGNVDRLAGSEVVRSTAIFFLIGNEGISILENLGLMGVPYPDFIKKAFEVMRKENDGRADGNDDN